MVDQQEILTITLSSAYSLIEDICSVIYKSGRFKPGVRPWWRGHADFNWKLKPLLYRKDKGDPAYEMSIAKEFMLEAPVRYTNCPEKSDLVEWLQLMRHYGLPTRLLDWTHSPLAALFFAVWEPKYDSEPGALWALNPWMLNKVQSPDQNVIFPDDEPIKNIAKRALDYTEAKYPRHGPEALAFFPTHIDFRMMLQQSVFTIHATRDPLEELKSRETFLLKIEIPHLYKETVRVILRNLGFTERGLFPDLDHLARDLRGYGN